jgi:hypothetical protein
MLPELLVSVDDGPADIVRATLANLRQAELVCGGKLTDANEIDLQMAICFFRYNTATECSIEDVRAWADQHQLRVLATRTPPDPTWPDR